MQIKKNYTCFHMTDYSNSVQEILPENFVLFSVPTCAVLIRFDYFQGIYILIQITIALFSSKVSGCHVEKVERMSLNVVI
jgi:hypothetical protein